MLRVLKEGRFVSGGIARLKYMVRSQEFRSSGVQDEDKSDVGKPTPPSPPLSRGGDSSRFAVVCSKKVFKRAVDRNRAKRLVRESVRLILQMNNKANEQQSKKTEGHGGIKSGYDMVFLIQSGIAGMKQQEVQEEVEVVLRKAGLLISN